MRRSRGLFIGRNILLMEGLRSILSAELEGLWVAADRDSVLSAAARFGPDIAIVELHRDLGGIALGRVLHEAVPGIRVLYVTSEDAPGPIVPTISTRQSPAELRHALRMCGLEQQAASARPAAARLDAVEAGPKSSVVISNRACEVISLLLRGMSMKEVGRQLGITARTVAFHKYQVMEANGLRNNGDLLRFAIAEGLLSLDKLGELPPNGRGSHSPIPSRSTRHTCV